MIILFLVEEKIEGKKGFILVVMVVSVKSEFEFFVKVMNLVFIGKEMDFLLYIVILF